MSSGRILDVSRSTLGIYKGALGISRSPRVLRSLQTSVGQRFAIGCSKKCLMSQVSNSGTLSPVCTWGGELVLWGASSSFLKERPWEVQGA